ncbi:MAG: hypothetical protein PHR35_20575 [Kiritimatiellae bacterium]|nr:hypothetical protein [Kiritimatiellia bacterium]
MGEKLDRRINLRADPDEWAAFEAACRAVHAKPSSVMRDLTNAAVGYIHEVCAPRGRWLQPDLTQYIAGLPPAIAHSPIHVRNGSGKVSINKKFVR